MSEYKGHNVRSWPSPEGLMVTLAVLRSAPDGWRCYQAIFRDPQSFDYTEEIDWCSKHGSKLTPAAAREQFPGLAESERFAR